MTVQENYNADAIEVLSGLDPVKKRPGMYTETVRPNHLAQEVIDNSVDEALAGHASQIDVVTCTVIATDSDGASVLVIMAAVCPWIFMLKRALVVLN